MKLLISPLAASDIEEIGDYIAQDNPARAISFMAELEKQCQKICINPKGYRKRPELDAEIRSCAYGRYIIYFENSQSSVLIIRVLHSARDVG
ncbi:type II toxin-antitoxin system RelE/ParE family toxin [Limnohabitans sp. TS-CS-82]|uniref:type II toxin-antitoxin system RelE/ParE family toxin n=1 Tax=Limnohabitans sp. TS-CS-82 TaxID=2094193 RepID=UPI000CF1E858|nr:type II toxin-antitoxin system RelE/ParE family toxin [Limnohabitans sp. TS-CS-82]PQA81501.1 type II toxin-antitoxin system RelE/ParE family toxin [Limnohabitans sp. TS-CS-82]